MRTKKISILNLSKISDIYLLLRQLKRTRKLIEHSYTNEALNLTLMLERKPAAQPNMPCPNQNKLPLPWQDDAATAPLPQAYSHSSTAAFPCPEADPFQDAQNQAHIATVSSALISPARHTTAVLPNSAAPAARPASSAPAPLTPDRCGCRHLQSARIACSPPADPFHDDWPFW